MPAAIEFLEGILTPEARVFEWGMGGSTPWLADRCGLLWSVDHNPAWFEACWQELCSRGHVNLLLYPPEGSDRGDASDPDAFLSSCKTGSFERYVKTIGLCKDYDVVLVDGRARASCIKAGAEALKPGGWLVVDNTERDWYLRRAGEYLKGWQCVVFKESGWQTSFWRKPGGECCE